MLSFRKRVLLPAVLALGNGIVGAAAAQETVEPPPTPSEPAELGLTERAERRLAQIDTTVSGPRELVGRLTPADFELRVGGMEIDRFTVDLACPSAVDGAAAADRPAASLLFFFDQPFLTMDGRNQALETARTVVRQLMGGDHRAMVVSSGDVLTTYTDWTTDIDTLLEAIERVEQDPRQWDTYAMGEDRRIQAVLQRMSDTGQTSAIGLARQYQLEEAWRVQRSANRLSSALGRLGEVAPPKAVLYFADRIRANPGEHFLGYFSGAAVAPRSTVTVTSPGADPLEVPPPSPGISGIDPGNLSNPGVVDSMSDTAASGAHSLDRVIRAAHELGVRLYAIQAEGISKLAVDPMTPIPTLVRAGQTASRNVTDAQNTLSSMAAETGGLAFLGGMRASRIASGITDDLACVALFSFDPAGLDEDRPLVVRVTPRTESVQVHARGQTLIPSASSRLTSRLLAAFNGPGDGGDEERLVGALVPTGFADGRFSVLIQAVVEGLPVADTVWDIGISLLAGERVSNDASSRVSMPTPETPLILETEMELSPGAWEVVLVAHESRSDQLSNGRLNGTLPDPDAAPFTVVPSAALQPVNAAFVREGAIRPSGALGHGARPLRADRPTALVGLICRDRGRKTSLVQVERRLVGESAAAFPAMALEFQPRERCTQIRDMIPAGAMTEGRFSYEIRVLDGETEVASGTTAFVVLAAGSAEPGAGS